MSQPPGFVWLCDHSSAVAVPTNNTAATPHAIIIVRFFGETILLSPCPTQLRGQQQQPTQGQQQFQRQQFANQQQQFAPQQNFTNQQQFQGRQQQAFLPNATNPQQQSHQNPPRQNPLSALPEITPSAPPALPPEANVQPKNPELAAITERRAFKNQPWQQSPHKSVLVMLFRAD